MNNQEVKILIFGDICPTADTREAFERGDRDAIFGELVHEIDRADIVIGNLECAVTDNPLPIQKAGPVLYTSSKSINSLKGFTALSLANNHIRDCGNEGVMAAIETCKQLGIRTFGAGENIDEAREPIIIEKNGVKIGLMSFAEREFNAATSTRPGAYCFDVYEDFDRIRDFRKSVDYLIILYHGGIEYFPYPSPELKRKCRKMAECGADFISCQHSHCIGTIEDYGGSVIIYGQGNSVFGYRKGDISWNRGLLVEINIETSSNAKAREVDSKLVDITYRPMAATSGGLKWMQDEESAALKLEMAKRANDSEEDIAQEWDKFCLNLGAIHIPLLLGWPHLMIALNRRTNNILVKMLYGKKASNITHNLIRCDAHREVIEYLLTKKNFK